MKQNMFVIAAMIFSCTITGVETACACRNTPITQLIDIYVRRDENVPPNRAEPLIFVGTFNLVASIAGQDVTIQVDDQRTNMIDDTRRARTESDRVLTANLLYPISSEIIIQ